MSVIISQHIGPTDTETLAICPKLISAHQLVWVPIQAPVRSKTQVLVWSQSGLCTGVLCHHKFHYIIKFHCELGGKSQHDLVANSLKQVSLINLFLYVCCALVCVCVCVCVCVWAHVWIWFLTAPPLQHTLGFLTGATVPYFSFQTLERLPDIVTVSADFRWSLICLSLRICG